MYALPAYLLAAVAEIAGCFAFWAWLRLDKSSLWLLPGMASLALGRDHFDGAVSVLAGKFGTPTLSGLPVLAFQVVNYVNANVTPGVLANYAASSALSARRACADATGAALACP